MALKQSKTKRTKDCSFISVTGHSHCDENCHMFIKRDDGSSFCLMFKLLDRICRLTQKAEKILDHYIDSKMPNYRPKYEKKD